MAERPAPSPSKRQPRTSKDDPAFLATFMKSSRLHFIGAWKERYQELLDSLPEPEPPLPPPPPPVGRERVIFHLDMDCFFASVAAAGHPELAGVPLAVCHSAGGTAASASEISTCNYEARAFGVRKGMWLRDAHALCPALVTRPYEFERYAAAAESMYRALFSLTPWVLGLSCDEAVLDVTDAIYSPNPETAPAWLLAASVGGELSPSLSSSSPPPPSSSSSSLSLSSSGAVSRLAQGLRRAVFSATGCACSVGSGPTRILARVALGLAKPNRCSTGHVHLARGAATQRALDALPIRDLPQVGSKTAAKITAALAPRRTVHGGSAHGGPASSAAGKEAPLLVGELRRATREGLVKLLGAKGGAVWDCAHGNDGGSWESRAPPRKSVSSQVADWYPPLPPHQLPVCHEALLLRSAHACRCGPLRAGVVGRAFRLGRAGGSLPDPACSDSGGPHGKGVARGGASGQAGARSLRCAREQGCRHSGCSSCPEPRASSRARGARRAGDDEALAGGCWCARQSVQRVRRPRRVRPSHAVRSMSVLHVPRMPLCLRTCFDDSTVPVLSRSIKPPAPVSSAEEISSLLLTVWRAFAVEPGQVRGLGVVITQLSARPGAARAARPDAVWPAAGPAWPAPTPRAAASPGAATGAATGAARSGALVAVGSRPIMPAGRQTLFEHHARGQAWLAKASTEASIDAASSSAKRSLDDGLGDGLTDRNGEGRVGDSDVPLGDREQGAKAGAIERVFASVHSSPKRPRQPEPRQQEWKPLVQSPGAPSFHRSAGSRPCPLGVAGWVVRVEAELSRAEGSLVASMLDAPLQRPLNQAAAQAASTTALAPAADALERAVAEVTRKWELGHEPGHEPGAHVLRGEPPEVSRLVRAARGLGDRWELLLPESPPLDDDDCEEDEDGPTSTSASSAVGSGAGAGAGLNSARLEVAAALAVGWRAICANAGTRA